MSGHTVHQFGRIYNDAHELVGLIDPWGIERPLLVPGAVATLPPAEATMQGLILTTIAQNSQPSATFVCHGNGQGAFSWVKLA